MTDVFEKDFSPQQAEFSEQEEELLGKWEVHLIQAVIDAYDARRSDEEKNRGAFGPSPVSDMIDSVLAKGELKMPPLPHLYKEIFRRAESIRQKVWLQIMAHGTEQGES